MTNEAKDERFELSLLYRPENLKPNDKRTYEYLEKSISCLLEEDTIENYFSDYYDKDGLIMHRTRSFIKDQLQPFLNYLREKAELCKLDVLFDMIEGYDENDITRIKRKINAKYIVLENSEKIGSVKKK